MVFLERRQPGSHQYCTFPQGNGTTCSLLVPLPPLVFVKPPSVFFSSFLSVCLPSSISATVTLFTRQALGSAESELFCPETFPDADWKKSEKRQNGMPSISFSTTKYIYIYMFTQNP